MTPSPRAPTEETPKSTPVALVAGVASLLLFAPALVTAEQSSGFDLMPMVASAGIFGWATIGLAAGATCLIALVAFLSGRVLRVPTPICAVLATLPALCGALGTTTGVDAMIEASGSSNWPTLALLGFSEALMSEVLGCFLAASCFGGAALGLTLAGLARRGVNDRAYRVDLLASAVCLLGGSWVSLLRGWLAGDLGQAYSAAADWRTTELAAATIAVTRDEAMLVPGLLAAVGVALAAAIFDWRRCKRLGALATAAVVLVGSTVGSFWINSAQRSCDAHVSRMVERPKLIRINGSSTAYVGGMFATADRVSLDDQTDPAQILEKLINQKKLSEELHRLAGESQEIRATYQLMITPDASAQKVRQALALVHAAGYEECRLLGDPEPRDLSTLPERLRALVASSTADPVSIEVELADAAKECTGCVPARIEGDELVLTPLIGAPTRTPIRWDEGLDVKAVFQAPTGDVQQWVMALSMATYPKPVVAVQAAPRETLRPADASSADERVRTRSP